MPFASPQNVNTRECLNRLGENMRDARERADLGQRELADIIDRASGIVSGWERGLRRPSLESLARYATACEVEVEELLAGVTNEELLSYSNQHKTKKQRRKKK